MNTKDVYVILFILLCVLSILFYYTSTEGFVATCQTKQSQDGKLQCDSSSYLSQINKISDTNYQYKCCTDPDNNGKKGPVGATGSPGIMGPIGLTGSKGEIGTQGIKGISGIKGPTGPKGDSGPIGLTGDRGPSGDTGPMGRQGPIAVDGQTTMPTPIQGPKGPTGDPGPTGFAGEKGPLGQRGPPGEPGIDGIDGVQGPPGEDSTEKGLPGIQGPAGVKGPTRITELQRIQQRIKNTLLSKQRNQPTTYRATPSTAQGVEYQSSTIDYNG